MSVTTSLSELVDLFQGIDPDPSDPPLLVQIPGHEGVNLETFPAVVGWWDWTQDSQVEFHGDMHSHHRYHLLFYVLVGGSNTPIEELHSRLEPWPVAIGHALFKHIALRGDVEFLGDGQGPLFTYRVGFWPLGPVTNGRAEQYFGLRFSLMVNEEAAESIGI